MKSQFFEIKKLLLKGSEPEVSFAENVFLRKKMRKLQ